jgi:hypothetical protein
MKGFGLGSGIMGATAGAHGEHEREMGGATQARLLLCPGTC